MTHVLRYGSTDKLPRPFEYEAIKSFQHEVLPYLGALDLDRYRPQQPLRVWAPKSDTAFRLAMELDPFDNLLLCAMAHEAAPAVESHRIPKSRMVSCAFRLDVSEDGRFFERESGWPVFTERSRQLAESDPAAWVLLVDVHDFYSQIYHHRVNNCLVDAGLTEGRARDLEGFLASLTAQVSQGIPIGPTASIIIAEACMTDVDLFLIRKGLTHTRYVDDIRIFVKDQRSGMAALHSITQYLYAEHRLTLNDSKTRLCTRQTLLDECLEDPGSVERRHQQSVLEALVGEMADVYGYLDEVPEPPDIPEDEITRAGLSDFLAAALEGASLNYASLRHILKRATQLRTRVLVPMVRDNLARLTPVLPNALQYLVTTLPSPNSPFRLPEAQSVGEALSTLGLATRWRDVPFVRMWVIDAIAQCPQFLSQGDALKLAEFPDAELSRRCKAILAKAYRVPNLVREQKDLWRQGGAWSNRAVVWAGSCLPADERKAWLSHVEESADPLTALVAKAARTSP